MDCRILETVPLKLRMLIFQVSTVVGNIHHFFVDSRVSFFQASDATPRIPKCCVSRSIHWLWPSDEEFPSLEHRMTLPESALALK